MFLDIACFFKWEDKDFLIDIWESCGFFPETGLRVLAENSLVTISECNLEVHDLLCEMGKEVVRQESTKEPGERSRLWLFEDVRHVFKHNTGTKAVEGILLDISNIEELQLTREAFRKMYNLRYLKITNYSHAPRIRENLKLHFPHGLEGLSDELRYLQWHGFPLKCLPCNFQPENLVELNMPYSNLEQPWEATKNMKNLKRLILTHSWNLKDIGDLSLARNLEFIDLEGCISLEVIHPSIQYLNKLKKLNLRDCKNLRSPLETAGLVSLKVLTLSGCSKITELLDNLGDLSSLVVLQGEKIGINRLPSSVSDLKSLRKMLLSGCKGKNSAGLLVPPLWGLDSLKVLKLKNFNILEFPEDALRLSSLETLNLSGNSFERIDLSLGPLSNLSELKLNECKMLQLISNLPPNIIKLQAHNCNSLEIVSSSICKREISLYTIPLSKRLNMFVFTNCFNLKRISLGNVMIHLLKRLQVEFASIKEDQDLRSYVDQIQDLYSDFRLCYPGSEIPEWFTHQDVGSSLNFQLQPPEMNSTLVGFIVCAVVAFVDYCPDYDFLLGCNFRLTRLDIFESFLFEQFWFKKKSYINSDHVMIGVAFRAPGAFFGKANFNSDHVIMKFSSLSYDEPFSLCEIKSCGARPVYALECKEQQKYKLLVDNATSFSLTAA